MAEKKVAMLAPNMVEQMEYTMGCWRVELSAEVETRNNINLR